MMAAPKKQLVKYCRVFQWIEAHDEEFATAIRDLCLKKALDASEGGSLTFLYPDDAYRREIVAEAYTDRADDAACKINSLIVDGCSGAFAPGASYTSHCGSTFTAVGANMLQSSDGAQFSVAAVADFASRAGSNICVMQLTGRPSTKRDATGAGQARRRKAKKLAAGHRTVRGGGSAARAKIAQDVEQAYAACVEKDGCRTANPYLGSVVSLLNYLKANRPDVLQAVLLSIDYEPVTAFYILVEPYRAAGHAVSDDIIAAWGNAKMYTDAVAEYKAYFESLAGQTGSASGVVALGFSDRPRLLEQTDQIRQDIGAEIRSVAKRVDDAYGALTMGNQIGSYGPVFPDATLALYAGSKLRLWQDMFRYCMHKKLCDLRAYPFNRRSFGEIVECIRAWQSSGALPMGDLEQASGDLVARFKLVELWCFVNSYDFLYIPSGRAGVGHRMGDGSPKAEEPLNRAAEVAPALAETTGMQGLSGGALAEIQAAIAANGGALPAQIQAML